MELLALGVAAALAALWWVKSNDEKKSDTGSTGKSREPMQTVIVGPNDSLVYLVPNKAKIKAAYDAMASYHNLYNNTNKLAADEWLDAIQKLQSNVNAINAKNDDYYNSLVYDMAKEAELANAWPAHHELDVLGVMNIIQQWQLKLMKIGT